MVAGVQQQKSLPHVMLLMTVKSSQRARPPCGVPHDMLGVVIAPSQHWMDELPEVVSKLHAAMHECVR